jgi:hypothetical protein
MANKNAPGGRGKKAPYKTEHYRIPVPIKPLVQVLANQYRELMAEKKAEVTFTNLVELIKDQAVILDQPKEVKELKEVKEEAITLSAYEFSNLLYKAWFKEAETKAGRNCFGHPVALGTLAEKMELEQKDFLELLVQVESDLLELMVSKKKNYKVGEKRVGALTFHTPMSLRPDNFSVI